MNSSFYLAILAWTYGAASFRFLELNVMAAICCIAVVVECLWQIWSKK